MEQTWVDGVPVFVSEEPGTLSAGLVFGVGRRDESFVKGGLTHLVEHLAMSAVSRTALDCNACVDLDTTEFTATGPPDRVAAFLAAVCGALAHLPLDRMAVEVDVLRTENGAAATPVVGTLLTELHGLTGFGLAGAREPAMAALTADDVRGWASRWFHRGNAAMWLTGPVPAGLALPLPDGTAPARSWPTARQLPTPAWTAHAAAGAVLLGAEVTQDAALPLALGILRERVEDELRHRRGVTYTVEADRLPVAPERRLAVLVADVREGNESLAAHVLWRQLDRLAADGPEEDELARERERAAAVLDDPRATAGEVAVRAVHVVLGTPWSTAEDVRLRTASVGREDVRAAARAVRDGAVLCVPQDTDSVPAGLTELTPWSREVVPGRSFRRRRGSDAPKGAHLVVGDEGVSLVLREGEQLTARWADVVGLLRSAPGEWHLASREGISIPLVVADWRDGGEALATVRAAVPAELQAVEDELADAEAGLLLFRAPAHRVREAVAASRTDADVVAGGEWTAVRPHGGELLEVVHAGLAGHLGGRVPGLALWHRHADLEYVLLRGTRTVDRHRWGAGPGDATALAEATGRDPGVLSRLLLSTDAPEAVVPELVTALGLPPEVPDLLAGLPVPSAQPVRGQGTLASIRGAVRGDHAGEPGTGGALERWAHLGRTRPRWYRALNALAAALCALALWVMLVADPRGGWSWAVVAPAGIGLVCSLADTRPPGRAEVPRAPVHEEAVPTG